MVDFPHDFLNQPIKVGRKIVYVTGGTSPGITLATVVELIQGAERRGSKRPAEYEWKIKAKRLRDRIGALRPEGGYANYTDSSYRSSEKVIPLTYPERIIVVHPDAT